MAAATLDDVLRELADLRARVDTLETASGKFASDKDLGSKYGDPEIKFVPRDWRGTNFKGARYSQTSPEFLDVLAESLEWSAANPKAGKEQYVKYSIADAKRARGWARRLRAGWAPPDPGAAFDAPATSFQAPSLPTSSFQAPAFDPDPFVGVPGEPQSFDVDTPF